MWRAQRTQHELGTGLPWLCCCVGLSCCGHMQPACIHAHRHSHTTAKLLQLLLSQPCSRTCYCRSCLQGCKQWLVLNILNKHIAFEVSEPRGWGPSGTAHASPLHGKPHLQHNAFNRLLAASWPVHAAAVSKRHVGLCLLCISQCVKPKS